MSNKFKILHIIPNLKKGGAERLVINICNELQRIEGVEVNLVTFSDLLEYNDIEFSFVWHVIPSKYIPSITGKAQNNTTELSAFIHEFQPNIIHTHLWEAEIVSRQVTFKRATWFSHFHDNMKQLKPVYFPKSKSELTDLYERNLMLKKYKACKNNFITISNHAHSYAQKVLPSLFPIVKLHNAIDFGYFKRTSLDNKDATKLELVTVGSLVDKKNQMFLIPIIKELKNKGINCVLHIAGEGPNKKMLIDKVNAEGVTDEVLFYGNADVKELYWKAHVYVHSALYEPFGLVLLEAMAAGLPVVCINGGGNSDIIENRYNGYIVDSSNIEAFTQSIIDLWIDKTLHETMSKNCVNFAKKFDIKIYTQNLLQVYKKAITKNI